MASQKIYLYLARRDKKGIQLLSSFSSSETLHPTRVSNVETLKLPKTTSVGIAQKIHDNRMLWEPWIQTSANYNDLVKSLRDRGYSNVPIDPTPAFSNDGGLHESVPKPHQLQTKSIQSKAGMLRRIKP